MAQLRLFHKRLKCIYCDHKIRPTKTDSLYFLYFKCTNCKLNQMMYKDDYNKLEKWYGD